MSSIWWTNPMQHRNDRLNRWSLYEMDIFVLGAMKMSKWYCLFHGFAELSLLMNNGKHFIAFVMKFSFAKSASTKKQSTRQCFGCFCAKTVSHFSMTVRLWLVLSAMKKSMRSNNCISPVTCTCDQKQPLTFSVPWLPALLRFHVIHGQLKR